MENSDVGAVTISSLGYLIINFGDLVFKYVQVFSQIILFTNNSFPPVVVLILAGVIPTQWGVELRFVAITFGQPVLSHVFQPVKFR